VDGERFNSAYRVGLGIALAYVLWALGPSVVSYTRLVVRTARHSHAEAARQQKLSASGTEAALLRAKQFAPNSQLHCTPAEHDWDYVCSYLPTPRQSQTRLQFGITVDARRWLDVSRIVPMGTIIPPPQRTRPGP
jgi:hypothetical protein